MIIEHMKNVIYNCPSCKKEVKPDDMLNHREFEFRGIKFPKKCDLDAMIGERK